MKEKIMFATIIIIVVIVTIPIMYHDFAVVYRIQGVVVDATYDSGFLARYWIVKLEDGTVLKIESKRIPSFQIGAKYEFGISQSGSVRSVKRINSS